MGFWIYMAVMNFLIPITMIVFGWVMKKHTPKKINYIFGYRTTMSMKNENTWKFAHEYCGSLWLKWGLILAAISAIVTVFMLIVRNDRGLTESIGLFTCLAQTAVLLISIIPTERALKRKFDKDGNLKN